jgi:hypothetical protein
MSPAIRAVGALICLGLVAFGTSLTRAAPKFSDWNATTNLGPIINSPS